MKRFLFIQTLLVLVAGLVAIAATPPQNNDKATTMTGVVIQKGSDYELAETQNMTPVAKLQGVEFSTGNFANYIGQTVRVKGTLVTEKDQKVLRVRHLGDIVRTTPAAQPQQPQK